jgi:hypothetical protein
VSGLRRSTFCWAVASAGCQLAVSDIDEYRFPEPGAGAGGGADGPSTGAAAGGTGAGGVADASGGPPRSSETAADGTRRATAICLDGQRTCDGDAVRACVAGSWGERSACPAAAPACSGGVCGTVRLAGRLVTLSADVAAGADAAGVRAVRGGFERLSRTCGAVNADTVCVSGGIRP